jgi:ArsR family transcriptional regulator
MKKNELNDKALALIAGRFRLLADPMRLKILHTLSDKEMSVGELVTATGANQANVSKHLGVLLEAGVVSRRKQGLTANYRVTDETIFALCDVVCSRLRDQFETSHNALANIF